MAKRTPNSTRPPVFQVAIRLAWLLILVTLLCPTRHAAAQREGFYPPLPNDPSATATPPPPVCDLTEEFDDINHLAFPGWVRQNNSQAIGNTNWFQGNSSVFGSRSGASNSYSAANYQNGYGLATIINLLITPSLTIQNGAQFGFWMRTVSNPLYPDRLQVRLSLNGDSSDVGITAVSVGDFTELLLDQYVYHTSWTQVVITISDVPSPVTGRLAFRYFFENGGPDGWTTDYLGIDSVQYCCTSCGLPTPTPVPTPTPTPATPTPSPSPVPTPCSCGGVNVSGTIVNCANVSRAFPIPNVTITYAGPFGGGTVHTGANGFYSFHADTNGTGGVGVLPSKSSFAPGSAGINTLDVIATQKHFLAITLFSGCRLTAGDVNQDGAVNAVDVIALQRFFLGYSTGTARVGQFHFFPSSRSYQGNSTLTGENYNTFVFGDVAEPFVQ
jgi:hypothetical protein